MRSAPSVRTVLAVRTRTRGRTATTGSVPLRLSAVAVVVLVTSPIAYVVASTVGSGWETTSSLVLRPRVAELLWNTVRLVVLTVVSCAVLGTATAWIVERSSLPGRRVWNVLFTAPLAVPAFVNSFAWVSLVPSAQGLVAAWVIVTMSYFPFVHLPVAAALRGLDPAAEEVSRSLALSPLATFGRTVLPQLRPALLGGSLLVALHLLAEFGALQMLQFPTFTTAIYDQYRSSFAGPAATSLAAVLVLACLSVLLLEHLARGRAHYARLGAGARRTPTPARLGPATVPALLLLGALVAASLGLPLASLGHWLLVGTSTAFPLAELAATTGTSLGLGLAGALAATALALPLAWLSVRHRGRLSTLLERASYVSSSLPGIVVALALVTVSIRLVPDLYQTTVVLVAAYVVMFLPRALVNVRAALLQAPVVLDDAAAALGAGRASRWWRVTLPLIAPGLGAGTALVFLAVVTELTATLLLSPTGTRTLATQFWTHTSTLSYGAAAPYALLMVLLSLPATHLLTRTSASPS